MLYLYCMYAPYVFTLFVFSVYRHKVSLLVHQNKRSSSTIQEAKS